MQTPPLPWFRLAGAMVLLSAAVFTSLSSAQSVDSAQERGTVTTTSTTASTTAEAGATSTEDDAPPTLFTVGLTGGFPSYQTAALALSFQAQFVGLQLKGSWTAVGPFIGAQVRAYPPIPVPLPVYVGVGGGVYGSNVSYHAAVGAHVPLSRATRLDVEGGVASVPLLDGRAWAPHVSVGVSYAIPLPASLGGFADGQEAGASVDVPDGRTGAGAGPGAGPRTCSAAAQPDESALLDAFRLVLRQWIDSARATYGSVYTDLRYDYDVALARVQGDEGTVRIRYRGSVREIATGTRHEASGEASATFRWNGCRWRNTGVSY